MPREAAERGDEVEQILHLIRRLKSRKPLYEMIREVRNNGDATTRGELELKDGTVLDAYSSPVVDKGHRYYGRIWTFRDITELRRYSDTLRSMSSTDALTDLPNRRRFDEVLENEWRRSMRDHTCLSLIMMDVDFFKDFNDHYGHLAGDECLKRIARCLSSVIRRAGELVARYGGEEFACILSNNDQGQAVTVAERLRNKINLLSIQHAYSSIAPHITMSFGVATMRPDQSLEPSKLVMEADELLYSAKKSGRNRITYLPLP
jgi:diguanylate cyclase (GGDEF)-like protein